MMSQNLLLQINFRDFYTSLWSQRKVFSELFYLLYSKDKIHFYSLLCEKVIFYVSLHIHEDILIYYWDSTTSKYQEPSFHHPCTKPPFSGLHRELCSSLEVSDRWKCHLQRINNNNILNKYLLHSSNCQTTQKHN